MIDGLPDPLPADPDARLALIGRVMIDRVGATIPSFIARSVERIIDAWGRLDHEQRIASVRAAGASAPGAQERIVGALTAEILRPAHDQRYTPLELVSDVVAEPTAILAALGIPPVVRDARDESIHPEDRYDLTPRSLADLGDPDLGPLQLAWGLAKHEALRASSA